MAIVSLKNVTVARVNAVGDGFVVVEESESRGVVFKTFYKVWATGPHGLTVGDVVSVSGLLSVKVGDPRVGTDGVERTYADISINSPRIESEAVTADRVSRSKPLTEFEPTNTRSNVSQSYTSAQPNTYATAADEELPF